MKNVNSKKNPSVEEEEKNKAPETKNGKKPMFKMLLSVRHSDKVGTRATDGAGRTNIVQFALYNLINEHTNGTTSNPTGSF